jgi:hypothetical protein
MPWMSRWPRKTPEANSKANTSGMAGSVADADAILAKFGYAEPVAA